MIRSMGIVPVILVASTNLGLAQRYDNSSLSHSIRPPQVLGHTGTMYDGNNAYLRLPSEPDRYWQNLWSESTESESNHSALPTGASVVTSAGSSKVGGQN